MILFLVWFKGWEEFVLIVLNKFILIFFFFKCSFNLSFKIVFFFNLKVFLNVCL